jgi:glucosamine--fructose-6-phosphate aminotransferase (isomerizing)
MCGIFGAVFLRPLEGTDWCLEPFVNNALKAAEWRGQDAVGVATVRSNRIDVLKRPVRMRQFTRTGDYRALMREVGRDQESLIAVMGHSRLSTNGTEELHENNQPVVTQSSALIHNGIIVNADELRLQNRDLFPNYSELDSEVISRLLDAGIARGEDVRNVLSEVYRDIRGQACVAYAHSTIPGLVLFTNNGSLHYYHDQVSGVLVFASENAMLRRMIQSPNAPCSANVGTIVQCKPGDAIIAGRSLGVLSANLIRPSNRDCVVISQTAPSVVIDRVPQALRNSQPLTPPRVVKSESSREPFIFKAEEILALRRCSKCILPASFPGISFDESGVCSVCRNYQPLIRRGLDAFLDVLSKESPTGKPGRCVVALSGGRDSCFMLHCLKRELGLDVVAFTYDWGMVTDLARRNMSRMVSALGVEHILVSANIRQKRDNIRRNVEAWLQRPHPGTIPLFMAGDKQFFFYANKAARDTGSQHLVFGMNRLETTHFKTGFCGVFAAGKAGTHFQLSLTGKAKLLSFYGREMLLNPGLINRSWLDTLFGFASYYVFPHRYQQFFDYYAWNEKEVNETICSLYDWEVAQDTTSTWRIGDGTASFYNYAYLTLTGLTEVDAFRSNQIREGQLTRSQALEIMLEENRPRVDSFRWYCDTVKIDYRSAAQKINTASRVFLDSALVA